MDEGVEGSGRGVEGDFGITPCEAACPEAWSNSSVAYSMVGAEGIPLRFFGVIGGRGGMAGLSAGRA